MLKIRCCSIVGVENVGCRVIFELKYLESLYKGDKFAA